MKLQDIAGGFIMKKKIRKTLAVLSLLLAAAVLLPAESITTASKDDFNALASIWSDAHDSGEYEAYQEKLIELSQFLIPDDLYQYMLGEAMFYRYYACSFIDMPENEVLDVSLDETIAYCRSIESGYPVLKTVYDLFSSLQKTEPFKNMTPEIVINGSERETAADSMLLPDAQQGRMLMLRTLAEVDAMNKRYRLVAESKGGSVPLKFTRDAYLNVMEKPAVYYVITHEPVYAGLKEVLEISSKDVEAESYGAAADAFYRFEELVSVCEEIAASRGVPLSEILSEEAWTAMMLYHTDPFAVLTLSEKALELINPELEFIAEKCLPYVERINSLPEKREGSL